MASLPPIPTKVALVPSSFFCKEQKVVKKQQRQQQRLQEQYQQSCYLFENRLSLDPKIKIYIKLFFYLLIEFLNFFSLTNGYEFLMIMLCHKVLTCFLTNISVSAVTNLERSCVQSKPWIGNISKKFN